jgi:hypothetical protein
MLRHRPLLGLHARLALAAALAVSIPAACVGGPAASPTPTPTDSATPSVPPSATPTASPSATPGAAGAWAELVWSEGVLPPEGSSIWELISWRGGYVGIGVVGHPPLTTAVPPNLDVVVDVPAFLTSGDGVHWAIAQEIDRCARHVFTSDVGPCGGFPRYLVAFDDGLLAVTDQSGAMCARPGAVPYDEHCGVPMLWHTTDGTTWSEIESPSWSAAWANTQLLGVAGGSAGVVVIGIGDDDTPVIVHSADARTWDRLSLPAAFDRAVLRDVAAHAGGFVIVGSVGEPDPRWPHPVRPIAVGRPAAWESPDGVTWRAADVEGTEFAGGRLQHVGVGAEGLFALGIATPDEAAGKEPPAGWASSDGRTWRVVGQGAARPFGWGVESDGTHLVTFADGPGGTAYWASTDGVTWTQLTAGRPLWIDPEDRPDGLPAVRFWVVPNGLVVSVLWNVPQELSFARAVTRSIPAT